MHSPENYIERIFTEDLKKLLDKYSASITIRIDDYKYFPRSLIQVEIESEDGYLCFDLEL